MKIINSIIKKKTGIVLLIMLGVVSHSCFSLGMAGYSKYVFDSIAENTVRINYIITIGFGVVIWGSLSLFVKNWSIDYLINQVVRELKDQYIQKLIRLPMSSLEDEGKVITNYTRDIDAVGNLVRSVISVIRVPFEMILACAYLFYHNWLLAVIVIILLPPVILAGRYIGGKIQSLNEKYLTHNDEVLTLLTRIMRGIATVKAYAVQVYVCSDFRNHIDKQLFYDNRKVRYNAVFSGITDFFMGMPFIIVYVTCSLLFVVQEITVGTITLFSQLLNKITVPFINYNYVLMEYKEALVSVRRLNEIFEFGEEASNPEIGKNGIIFNHVSFGYKEDNVLDDINVTIEKGGYYGVTGVNGSGKTTFIKLLLGLYQPDEGYIDFSDSAPIGYNAVYIEDKPAILFDSIIENIALEKNGNEEKINELFRSLGMQQEEIKSLLDKKTSELSAGMLQRTSFIRGLYHIKRGDILILDEAFSASDIGMRDRMKELVRKYKEIYDLTVIEISHDMTGEEEYSQILKFENGKINIYQCLT